MTKINLNSLAKNPVTWEEFIDEEVGMHLFTCDVGGILVGEVRKEPVPHPDTVLRPWQAFRGFGPIRPLQGSMVRIKSGPPDNGSFKTSAEAKMALIRSLYFYWRTGEFQLAHAYVKPPKRRAKMKHIPSRPSVPTHHDQNDGDNQPVSRVAQPDNYEAPPLSGSAIQPSKLPPCPSCGSRGFDASTIKANACTYCEGWS